MQAGNGYWIEMASANTLSISGVAPSSSLSLLKGWNLAGYNGTACVGPSSAFFSLGANLQVSWAYPDQSWKVYDPNDAQGSTLTSLCPGGAYWIKVNQAATWTLSSSGTNEWTWVSGSKTAAQAGNYGTKGTAASTNVPGARRDPSFLDRRER